MYFSGVCFFPSFYSESYLALFFSGDGWLQNFVNSKFTNFLSEIRMALQLEDNAYPMSAVVDVKLSFVFSLLMPSVFCF